MLDVDELNFRLATEPDLGLEESPHYDPVRGMAALSSPWEPAFRC